MSIPIREFLSLIQKGLGDDPEMPVDIGEYADRSSLNPRTAYRYVNHCRAVIRSLREEGMKVSVRKIPQKTEKADAGTVEDNRGGHCLPAAGG